MIHLICLLSQSAVNSILEEIIRRSITYRSARMHAAKTMINPASTNNSQAQSFFDILFISKIFTELSPLTSQNSRLTNIVR